MENRDQIFIRLVSDAYQDNPDTDALEAMAAYANEASVLFEDFNKQLKADTALNPKPVELGLGQMAKKQLGLNITFFLEKESDVYYKSEIQLVAGTISGPYTKDNIERIIESYVSSGPDDTYEVLHPNIAADKLLIQELLGAVAEENWGQQISNLTFSTNCTQISNFNDIIFENAVWLDVIK